MTNGRVFFFFKPKTAYELGLGIPAEPLFRSCVSKNVSVSCAYTQGKREQLSGFNRTIDAINNVFRKFSAFHDETGRLNVEIGRAVQQECRDRSRMPSSA